MEAGGAPSRHGRNRDDESVYGEWRQKERHLGVEGIDKLRCDQCKEAII